MSPRQCLHTLYQAALKAVQGRTQVAAYLQQRALKSPVALIAIGKAATQMAAGAYDAVACAQALIITKKGHLEQHLLPSDPTITCLETAHPLPDQSSLAAGHTLIEFIQTLPQNMPVLVLISGGTSALVEVLPTHMTLADLHRLNQWLLGSGLDIVHINQIRKSVSAIKAGRLAPYLSGHQVINLLISDVPSDAVSVIGSGLLSYHEPLALPSNLPTWLTQLTQKSPPLAAVDNFAQIEQIIIAHCAHARQAACDAAVVMGLTGFNHETFIAGDAIEAGRTLAEYLKTAPAGIHIWSSETTVQLPEQPGQGGRCQSLALAAAEVLAGHPNIYFLAAGSDGNDGPGDTAGALVDGKTLERAGGFNVQPYLAAAAAGAFLAASGDLVSTGPTGTNVMDILIAYVQ
ncbi:MAG: DUF4147 domain-containing protein [Pseudomonadota bacterium]|nr:DUF4147 domain-containing protein [Pseudomonadota bacterium]